MGQEAQQLRNEIESTRENLGGTIDQIEDRVSPRRIVERRKVRMTDGLADLRDRVMGTAHAVTDKSSEMVSQVGNAGANATGSVKDAPQAAMQSAQGSPLMAGAVAAGIGFLASMIFPSTKAEQHAAARAEEMTEPLKQDAKHLAEEIKSSVQERGQSAAEELRESAATSGAHLVDEAKGEAEDVASQGRKTASSAVDAARNATTKD